MPNATYVLECDFNNDGDYLDTGEDLTPYLRAVEYRRGRDYASQLTGRCLGGELLATLNNTGNRFSSLLTTGPLYGNILPGRRVRLRSTAPTAANLWSGFLDTVEPLPDLGGAHRCQLRAVGALAYLNQWKVQVAMQTSILTGDAFDAVLDEAVWPAADRDVDDGKTTMTRWWADEAYTLGVLREIEEAENGFLWEGTNFKVVFHDRHVRMLAPYQASAATWTDAAGGTLKYGLPHGQRDPNREIFNIFEIEVTVYTVNSLAVLWTYPETGASSPTLAPGEAKEFWANYPNPGDPTDAIGVNAWTTTTATTDVTANTASDGSGTDLTTSLTIAVSKLAKAMKITLTNTDATRLIYLTLLQARGTAVIASDPATFQKVDSTSKTRYGPRTYPPRTRFVPNANEAISRNDWVASIYAVPQPIIYCTLAGNRSAAQLTEILSRDIVDRVTIVATGNSGLGVNEDFFVESLYGRIDSDLRHDVTYECSRASMFGAFFVLDTSVLDTGKLAY